MMASSKRSRKKKGGVHPIALAHALISSVTRQHQALLGYVRVLNAIPEASLHPSSHELLSTHLTSSMVYGSHAINHAVFVLEYMLARKSDGVLPPVEPYPILSTLALLQQELTSNLETLSVPTALGAINLDPFQPQATVTDWSNFAQTRFRVSPAEGSLIAQLIDGASIMQIAEATERSHETVRRHSKFAREKVAESTGVPIRNTARLVSVVLLRRLRELSGGSL